MDALLLDMDGVLVDSTGTVEKHWARWAARRGLAVDDVLREAHGAPSREVVALFVADTEVDAEAAWVEGLAMADCIGSQRGRRPPYPARHPA